MPGRTPLLRLIAALAVASGLVAAAHAADSRGAEQGKSFADKPRIEDYADYNSFLVDIMAYRQQKEGRGTDRSASSAPRASQNPPPRAAEARPAKAGPASPFATDPYSVRKPESLDEALERARYLKHPVYDTPLRFEKTTSQSFPLPPLEGEEMSVAELPGTLQDAAAPPPEPVPAPTPKEFAAAKAKTKTDNQDPTDDEESREALAAADTYAVTRAGVDAATGAAIDSEGQRHSLQIANKYTLGEEVDIQIHNLSINLEVEVLRR